MCVCVCVCVCVLHLRLLILLLEGLFENGLPPIKCVRHLRSSDCAKSVMITALNSVSLNLSRSKFALLGIRKCEPPLSSNSWRDIDQSGVREYGSEAELAIFVKDALIDALKVAGFGLLGDLEQLEVRF